MDILSKLFGSAARVKILKLFVFNGDDVFNAEEVAVRTNSYFEDAQKEITVLKKIKLIKNKTAYKELVIKKKGRKETVKRKISGYGLETAFPFLEQLSNLLRADKGTHKMVLRKLQPVGKLKLVLASGFLTEDADSRIDLLVVGDGLQKASLENAIKSIESEIGRELKYSAFETPEFEYRMSIYDRLVRDIVDFPHKKLLNRMGIE
jgi:hypothetical protein